MDWGSPAFIIAIIALSYGAWMFNNWIRAKHGYPLEDEWGGKSVRSDTGQTDKLEAENQELRQLLGRMEQRMRSLETIVTDKGYHVAEEIEALRGDEGSGVPLDLKRKERAQ